MNRTNTNTETLDKFYMVYRIGGSAPRVMHKTVGEAAAEAQRLSKLHIGETFVILEAVGAFKCPVPNPKYVHVC